MNKKTVAHDIALGSLTTDLEKILSDRTSAQERCVHTQHLVKKYKKQLPNMAPSWDTDLASISFNDICTSITSSGLSIYNCSMDELWAGLFDPSVYEAKTLWKNIHDPGKIAGVIDAWVNGTALSPIFLVKHEVHDQGLVADGKHRLTVSRAIGAIEVPFMVETAKAAWVSRALPSAICIHKTEPLPQPSVPAPASSH